MLCLISMNFKSKFGLLFFLSILSCTIGSEKNNVKQYLDILGINEPKNVLIIYIDGCQNCMKQHQELLSNIINKEGYQLVIVSKSPKKAKIFFGESLVNNAFFDTELLALDYGVITGFPMVYSFDDRYNYIGSNEIDYGANILEFL